VTARERRAADPLWRQLVAARLARIKAARASRETTALRERWQPNVIEAVLLRRRLGDDPDDARRTDGTA
jgi:hypothetical protein